MLYQGTLHRYAIYHQRRAPFVTAEPWSYPPVLSLEHFFKCTSWLQKPPQRLCITGGCGRKSLPELCSTASAPSSLGTQPKQHLLPASPEAQISRGLPQEFHRQSSWYMEGVLPFITSTRPDWQSGKGPWKFLNSSEFGSYVSNLSRATSLDIFHLSRLDNHCMTTSSAQILHRFQ